MENFISQTIKSCYYQLHRISSVWKYLSASETGHLTHSDTPWLLQFSLFWLACFLCPQPSSYTELCLILKKHKTDHITPLFQFLHWLPIQQRIQYKINTLCYKYIVAELQFSLITVDRILVLVFICLVVGLFASNSSSWLISHEDSHVNLT